MRPASSTCSALTNPWPSCAEQVIGRHAAVVEEHFARVAGAHAELVFLLAGRHARRAALDDERGDALRPCGAVGDRHHDADVARRAVRRERLRPVQHPAVAVARGRRPQAAGIAARRSIRSAPRRRSSRRARAARDTPASAPRCRTSRCAPSTGRCARRPTARRPDRRAPALRCRCSSRRPTCRRRRTPRATGCPAGRARRASGRARPENAAPRPTPGRAGGSRLRRTRARVRRSSCCSSVSRKSIIRV